MKSNFYLKNKPLVAAALCAAFLTFTHASYAWESPEPAYIQQQAAKIKGTVTDTNGESVIGASVMVKGTTNGTITDADGNFSLSDVPADATIVISFIGYKTQGFPVNGGSHRRRLRHHEEVRPHRLRRFRLGRETGRQRLYPVGRRTARCRARSEYHPVQQPCRRWFQHRNPRAGIHQQAGLPTLRHRWHRLLVHGLPQS